jgi:hypothetical protein
VYRRVTVIVLVSDRSPAANATATLNVAEFAFEDPTVTPPPPLKVYCVVPPTVSVAGFGNTMLNELLLQICAGGVVVGFGTVIAFLIVLVNFIFGLSQFNAFATFGV